MIKERISNYQFSLLVILFSIGSSILILPSGMAAEAKQDGWIAVIIGVLIGGGIVLLYNRLSNYLGENTIALYLIKEFGVIGRIISVFFSLYAFLGAATVLFYVGDFVNSEILNGTPVSVISIMFAILVVFNIRIGIENIARVAELLFPWVIIFFILLVGLLTPLIRLENLRPVLETNFKSISWAAINFAGTASLPFVVLLMVFPSRIDNKVKGKKTFLISNFIGGSVMVIITLLTILVIGAQSTAGRMFPSYDLAKLIRIGDFFQRVEIIIALLWFVAIYFKVTLYFYASILSMSQALVLDDYRSLSLPFGILLTVFSLVVYPNIAYMKEWDSTVYIPYVITFSFILPVSLLAYAEFKSKHHKG